jgi:hypothetical protein
MDWTHRRAEWRHEDTGSGGAFRGAPGGDAQQLFGDLGALVQGFTGATRDLGGALRAAEDALERRPYVAIGLAAALGVLVGFAIQRGVGALGEPAADDGWDHFV